MDEVAEIKKYLKKLNMVIQNYSTFSFGNYKLVDKKRIDDLICCIDANWPKILKSSSYVENLKSEKMYKIFLKSITNTTFVSSSLYFIKFNIFIEKSNLLIKTIISEINEIKNNE